MWKEAELNAEYRGEEKFQTISYACEDRPVNTIFMVLASKSLGMIQENKICPQVQKKQLLCNRIKYNF